MSVLHRHVDFGEEVASSSEDGHVHFCSKVCIKLIPSRKQYSAEDKAKMWFSTSELDNSTVNDFEFDVSVVDYPHETSCEQTRDKQVPSCQCTSPISRAKPRFRRSDAFEPDFVEISPELDCVEASLEKQPFAVEIRIRSKRPTLRRSNAFAFFPDT